jgi:acetyl-CoA synthetase (ADP-forming)
VDIIEKALREGRKTLSEYESKQLLKNYGIPVPEEREVRDRQSFQQALREIDFPLVLKACAPGVSHKTEQNLLRVDIRNEQEALAAYLEITAATADSGVGLLVQEMVKGQRELVAGLTRDPQFGPCVMFGLGGIFTEILQDVVFRVAPVERLDAMEMLQEFKAHKILSAVRGMPAANLDQLADILIKVGEIGLNYDRISEIDINPVILSGEHPVAVDALVVLNV